MKKPLPKAKANKISADKGAPLSSSVYEFWDLLFPDEPPATVAVSKWVADLVAGVEAAHLKNNQTAPLAEHDARRLAIRIDGLVAELSVRELNETHAPASFNAPLFRAGLSPLCFPEWEKENPFGRFLADPTRERWCEQSRALFEFAAYEAGKRIMAALQRSLTGGQLILTGAPMLDPFAEAQDIAAHRIPDALLLLAANQVKWTTPGAPTLAHVTIRRAIAPPPDRSGGQSFVAFDQPFVEEMREMILNRKAKNVSAAASLVAHKAKALGEIDSVIVRLRARYREKYPTRSKT